MARWTALSEYQLSVLRDIADGDDLGDLSRVGDRRSARALADRHLVTVTRRQGRWSATVTEAGRYYLEHGQYPSSPTTARSTGDRERPRDDFGQPLAGRAPQAKRDVIDPGDLIEQVRQSDDRILRIAHPDTRSRAAYRRAIHAARHGKLVPEGYELLYTGRRSGDIVIHLAAEQDRDRKAWATARYRARNEITDPEEIVAVLERSAWLNAVATDLHPLALDLCRALLAAAASANYQCVVRGERPRLVLDVGGRFHEVHVAQEHDQVPHVATPKEKRQAARNPWLFKVPEFDKVPAARLELFMNHGYNERERWRGVTPGTLSRRVREVVADLTDQDRVRREAHEAWRKEYEAQQEESRRRQEEQQRQWNEAMAQARPRAIDRIRAEVFGGTMDAWLNAQQIRDFCSALRSSRSEAAEGSELLRWVEWALSIADTIDPTTSPGGLAEIAFDVEPGPDDLRPFLGKWSPFRPEQEYRAEQMNRTGNASMAEAPQRAWHHGMRARPSWWQ